MRRLPPLAAIRAFDAAAPTENFTAAAAEGTVFRPVLGALLMRAIIVE